MYIEYWCICVYILVYTLIYIVVVPRTRLLSFHHILTALRRIVLMLAWRTVGMPVHSSFSGAICVQSMEVSQITVPTKLDQVYTCICMFEIMHVSIYNAYRCIYMQWCFAFQGDFPMFVHSRILLTCRRHRVRVRFEKTVCTFWICANSVHTWYIPVYTMYIVLCHMFSHSPGQVSYFLAVGQCVDVCSCQHTYSMHSTAYPAAKSEKNMFAGIRLCI